MMETITPEQRAANTLKNNLANYGSSPTVSLSALNKPHHLLVHKIINQVNKLYREILRQHRPISKLFNCYLFKAFLLLVFFIVILYLTYRNATKRL